MASRTTFLSSLPFLFSSFVLLLHISFHATTKAQTYPPIADGLSSDFYNSSCPKLQYIVRRHLRRVLKRDAAKAAGFLRLHFHDCFVLGCDGSVLLDGSASGPSEKDAPPNLSLQPDSFEIIDNLRILVHKQCGKVVSCADIVALAARDSVFLSGGPDYVVPLGRRDGMSFATINETLANIPSPTRNTSALLTLLASKNLDATDLVALSGAHTIGRSHCSSFTNRLYPTQDPTMDNTFAERLYGICPTSNSTNTTVMDFRSPHTFDNNYYVDLVNGRGLFTSDQDLYTDPRTRGIVTSFAVDELLFFERFVYAMTKMGQLSVLTGSQGEIRANCSVRNSKDLSLLSSSVVKNDGVSLE